MRGGGTRPVSPAPAPESAPALADSLGLLALNIKADGLIPLLGPLLDLLPRERLFFFDMTTPQLISYARASLPVAVRVSEFEPVDHSVFAKLDVPVRVWLDAFDSDWWLGDPEVEALCRTGQVAIVSPEIHGRDPEAVWAWFGEQVTAGCDLYLCTDRCDDAVDVVSRPRAQG